VPTWRAVAVLHPFPSSLDAAVTGLIAALAGAPAATVVQLGGAMLLLQFSIGAANDWSDAQADAMARPLKPIPAGLLRRREAATLAAVCAAAGLLLAAPAGPAVLAVALAGLLTGLSYDLGLKGTSWAWLAFAAGFVLLPLFAWLGGSGTTPAFLGWIVLLAIPAGAAVSLANGLVDHETDAVSGRRGPAVRLGPRRAHLALGIAHLLVVAGAMAGLGVGARGTGGVVALAAATVALGVGFQAVGWLLSGGQARAARLRGWHVQAIGLAVLAGGWFLGMTA
jgi:4-hydroxybenzoate polyprenyltransferase